MSFNILEGAMFMCIKKQISSILVITILLSIFNVSVFAETTTNNDNSFSGTCGDNLTWTLDEDGTLTISGSGDMKNFAAGSPAPWKSQRDKIKKVIICSGITSIGDLAFNPCSAMTEVSLPDTLISIGGSAFSSTGITTLTVPINVTSIEEHAFRSCGKLISVTISDAPVDISDGAFESCSALTEVNLGNSVLSIGSNVFHNCTSLTSVVIPSSTASIGYRCFGGCTSLDSVTIGNGVETIGESAFNGCSALDSITIPDSVTSIQSTTFANCVSLATVIIGDGVSSIGMDAFEDCSALTDITIGNNVESIGSYAFKDCTSVTSISIPKKVDNISGIAFDGCTNLSAINVAPDNATYWSFEGVLFNNDKKTLLRCPEGKTGYFAVPDTTVSIFPNAFKNCKKLNSVTVSDGLTSIGIYAFESCTSLESITLPNSVTGIGYYAFYGCSKLSSFVIPNKVKKIDSYTFYGCSSLQSIIIPDSVTAIAKNAFQNCTSLSTLTIGSSVASIGANAFDGCTSLLLLDIPSNVEKIQSCAFMNCTLLSNVTISDSVTLIGDGVFSGCINLLYITLPNGIASISKELFKDCSSLANITLPGTITTIEGSAFSGCSSLSAVTLPETVKRIEREAFKDCISLDSFVIPDGITGIYAETFSGCTELKSITIPSSVTRIETYSFSDCETLKSVELPEELTYIGTYAFSGCSSLETITVPDHVTTVAGHAFSGCTSLSDAVLPNELTSIGTFAFSDCKSLKTFTIPRGVTSIGKGVFKGCDSLQAIIIYDSLQSIARYVFDKNNSLTDIYYEAGKTEWNSVTKNDYDDYATGMISTISVLKNVRMHYYFKADEELILPFAGGITKEENQTTYIPLKWSFDYFDNNAEIYNNNLAIAGLVLSANSNSDSVSNLRNTMNILGFNRFRHNYNDMGTVGVGCAIASKEINLDGVKTNIIAVVIRGTTTVLDALADLEGVVGFGIYANYVKAYLDNYIETNIDNKTLPTKLFITGHSLGGAVSANVGLSATDITERRNIFVYTFEAPGTKLISESQSNNKNIHNIINWDDRVVHWPIKSYHPGRIYEITYTCTGFNEAYKNLTGGLTVEQGKDKKYGYGYQDNIIIPRVHAPVFCMAYLLSDHSMNFSNDIYSVIKKISVKCPVDVEVYDEYGTLVGRVVGNVVDETVGYGSLIFEIDGDEKYIYLPPSCNYTFKLTGNGNGSMEYSVQDINTETGEIQEEKVFTDVALTAGKTMTSEVAEDIETPDVQLFVEQNEEITKEILTDGSEKDIKIVSFETNGGNEIRDISVEPGSTLPQIEAPKKEGYIFVGWYIDDELNTTFDYESGISENITLYAKYMPAYQVFAKIADMTYDGEDLVIPVNFDYNHIDTAPWLAIYESGKLLKLQKCEIPAETLETDIEVSIPGLNGLYDVKMLFFSDMDTLRPLSSCAYNTLFAY